MSWLLCWWLLRVFVVFLFLCAVCFPSVIVVGICFVFVRCKCYLVAGVCVIAGVFVVFACRVCYGIALCMLFACLMIAIDPFYCYVIVFRVGSVFAACISDCVLYML